MKFKILVATLVAIVMSFYGTQVLAGRDAKGVKTIPLTFVMLPRTPGILPSLFLCQHLP